MASPPDVVFSDSIRELCLTMATKKIWRPSCLAVVAYELACFCLDLGGAVARGAAAFSLRSLFSIYTYVAIMIKNKSTFVGIEPLTTIEFGTHPPGASGGVPLLVTLGGQGASSAIC